jgi:hypothetical protein
MPLVSAVHVIYLVEYEDKPNVKITDPVNYFCWREEVAAHNTHLQVWKVGLINLAPICVQKFPAYYMKIICFSGIVLANIF